ncbi:hypothetical protein BC936DRAFT_138559 [Jimgerdemannia flammicorona]|uniref:Uncharacterized protein n=1 Tax=Jimgerdemannia flammicorona TaxID=994334 RepID=A0A433C4H5_9FUNG|nr:hypothetical protein BC936DRAFT_138559 [Jimgerdemannia flammicorona]
MVSRIGLANYLQPEPYTKPSEAYCLGTILWQFVSHTADMRNSFPASPEHSSKASTRVHGRPYTITPY